MSDADYLTNQLLIAMPMMGDPNFAQTVTLICEHSADGALGYFQHSFEVYDREGVACGHARCKGAIERIVQNGRSTFWCSSCQK